jgi:hypothetical protein
MKIDFFIIQKPGNMNKNFLIWSMTIFMVISSCSKYVDVSPSDLRVSSEAGSSTINIKANTDWTVTEDADWLTVSPVHGSDNGMLTADFTANTMNAIKMATITVTGSGVSVPVSVTLIQEAKEEHMINMTWTRKANLPTARGFLPPTASVVSGKIYVIGGTGTTNVFNTVEEYDPSANSWTTKASLLTQRWGHSSVVIGGKIYVMGGCSELAGDATASIEIYDPETNRWSYDGNMPAPKLGFASCVADGKIYTIGGRTKEPGGTFLASVEAYNPVTKTWQSRSPLPEASAYLTCTATSSSIYAIGGCNSDGKPVKTVYKYDIESDIWSEATSIHSTRWGIASCLVGNMIVCAGGYSGPMGPEQQTVEVILTDTDECLQATDMSFKRACCSVCAVNGKVYVLGGCISSPPTYMPGNYVEEGVIDLR